MELVSGGSDMQEGRKLEKSQRKLLRRNKFVLSVLSCISLALNLNPYIALSYLFPGCT